VKKTFVSPGDIRRNFSAAMSEMYCEEVPDYQTVIDLVKQVNDDVLEQNKGTMAIDATTQEIHGAIRLGKPSELSMMRRLFVVLGMYPVGYYDLSVASIPVHSTAFRSVSKEEIKYCPFRIFTSLLRLDLIEDAELRKKAASVLEDRSIFSDQLIDLLNVFETTGGLEESEVKLFIQELVKTFEWNVEANVSKDLYQEFHDAHRLIADVVSFKGPHINHLTPKTLDIDKVQDLMPEVGLNPKAVVEGPPKRNVPILLRQTAFKALKEDVSFQNDAGIWSKGAHTARFGEIEQRGIALTPKGQKLYDTLLAKAREVVTPNPDGSNRGEYENTLETVFTEFPDDLNSLRQKELAYFTFERANDGPKISFPLGKDTMETYLAEGNIQARPIIYEDFLPVSAAGIFQSNLGDSQGQNFSENANQAEFEQALGTEVLNMHGLYEAMQQQSINAL